MAKHITTSIEIKSDVQTVWKILTDFKAYPKWNPFIKSIEGEVAEGQKVTAKIAGMTFKPKVLTFRENSELKWLGHRFSLTENEGGTVHFEQTEKFTGILVPLFARSLDTDTIKGFNDMNKALKKRAEDKIMES
jgi:hypothetical protein